MSDDLIRFALERSLELGAEYSEAKLHRDIEQQVILRNSNPEPSMILDSQGISIRIVFEGAMAFSATNLLEREKIGRLVETSVKRAKSASVILRKKVKLSEEITAREKWAAKEKENLDDVTTEELIGVLKDLDEQVQASSGVNLSSRVFFLRNSVENKFYLNSEGAEIESRVPRVQFHSTFAIKFEGVTRTITIPPGYAHLGGSGGMEVLDRIDLAGYFPRRFIEISSAITAEMNSPKGEFDVVLGPEVAGLVAHESIGHPSEADRILGREAAQAGESYLGLGDVGKRIGSSEANVSDDPTLQNSMGYYKYDDEGVRARKRHLVSAGVISELLHNRETASEVETFSNGASRSMGYNREPIIRMANTFVEPGDFEPDEIFEDISSGVYIKSFMEWNIDDRRLNQRYVGLEAFQIENGELCAPVRDPVLEISTPKFWMSLDARGKDLSFTGATCGKGDPMQGAPVWTGGPHVRLRRLRISSR